MNDEFTRFKDHKRFKEHTQKATTLSLILEHFEHDYRDIRYTNAANAPNRPTFTEPYFDFDVAEKIYADVGENWHILSNRQKMAAFASAYREALLELFPEHTNWDVTFSLD